MRMKKKVKMFDIVNAVLVVFITLVIAYPLYFCVIASFSDPSEVALGRTFLWIKNFTLEAYSYVVKERSLWLGYRNSIIYTVFGTLYNLLLTIPMAYVLTKKYLPFRNLISWYFFITMYISGGLIPTYLNIKKLGLVDNPLVLIIGAGISCYNLIVSRQYFASSIPNDIYEAAYIDGASEWGAFMKIAMPLAKPIIAVMALYYGSGHWNSYYGALLYIRDDEYMPLQLILRKILILGEMALSDIEFADAEQLEYLIHLAEITQGMKYAIVFIASAPMLIAYPFVQKYFTKGVMIGAVKG